MRVNVHDVTRQFEVSKGIKKHNSLCIRPPQGNALSFRRKAAEYVLPVITIAAVLMVKHLSCVPQGRELPGVQGEFASFAESQGLGEYVGRLKKR